MLNPTRFGPIHYIKVEQHKKGALVKFRNIESAARAAKSTEPVFDNPKIKINYDFTNDEETKQEQPVKKPDTSPIP